MTDKKNECCGACKNTWNKWTSDTCTNPSCPCHQPPTKKSETNSVNFLQKMPGGHCYYCHEDFPDEHDYKACEVVNILNYHAPCDERCEGSKFYQRNQQVAFGHQPPEQSREEWEKEFDKYFSDVEDRDLVPHLYAHGINNSNGRTVPTSKKVKDFIRTAIAKARADEREQGAQAIETHVSQKCFDGMETDPEVAREIGRNKGLEQAAEIIRTPNHEGK